MWFNELTPDFITNWRQFKEAFLEKFFPSSRILQLRVEISNFRKLPNEALHKTWASLKIS